MNDYDDMVSKPQQVSIKPVRQNSRHSGRDLQRAIKNSSRKLGFKYFLLELKRITKSKPVFFKRDYLLYQKPPEATPQRISLRYSCPFS